jgi:hypothetical protein
MSTEAIIEDPKDLGKIIEWGLSSKKENNNGPYARALLQSQCLCQYNN